MQNVVTFWSDFLPIVCEFLLSDPIKWFTGILLLICLAGFLLKLLHFR